MEASGIVGVQLRNHMSYSPNCLKGGLTGLIKGDTRI